MPPRTRISEAPQRISTRDPHQQRRNSSDSDPLHHRPITDRSPRLFIDRRSPRGSQSDPPLNQRKLGTRISDLESQLVQAQRELKNLKHQLAASADDNNTLATKRVVERRGKHTPPDASRECNETDVFEVPMEKASAGPTPELDAEQLPSKVEAACRENEALRKQLHEVSSELSATKLKEEEMAVKRAQLEKELEASNEARTELMERLRAVGDAKEELEAEMKKLGVQTEQWRKAADAAAAVLAGGDVDRCGSMEKHFNSVFEPPPMGGGADDVDDGGKRKGSGIRMFGDLWKKRSQK